MSDVEVYISASRHNIDFPELKPAEVKRQLEDSTGVDLDSHLAGLQAEVRRGCADNCCFYAALVERSPGSILLANCGIDDPECQQRSNEGFEKAAEPIRAVFEQ